MDYEQDLKKRIAKAISDLESTADMAQSATGGILQTYKLSDLDYLAALSCYKQYLKLSVLVELYDAYFPNPAFSAEKEKMEQNLSDIEKKIILLMKT